MESCNLSVGKECLEEENILSVAVEARSPFHKLGSIYGAEAGYFWWACNCMSC